MSVSYFLWLSMVLTAVVSIGASGSFQVPLPKQVYSVYGQGVCLLGLLGAMGGIGTLLALLLIPR